MLKVYFYEKQGKRQIHMQSRLAAHAHTHTYTQRYTVNGKKKKKYRALAM